MKDKNKLPEGVTLTQLKENFDLAETHYHKPMRKARILDAADRARLWEATKVKFPRYQILTDSNHTAYIKNNLLASIYSVGKSPTLEMTSENDKQIITDINIALERMWALSEIGYYQMRAGERAALLNLGVTHVGWDASKTGGHGDTWYKGDVKLKNIDPIKYRRDPFADSIEDADFAVYWDQFHKSVIKSNPLYKKEMTAFLEREKTSAMQSTTEKYTDVAGKENQGAKGYYKVFVNFIRKDDAIYEVHTLNWDCALYWKEVKPAEIPIAELYCNLPTGDVVGTSEPAKQFANSLAYNMMNSIVTTAEYKNQRPPRFINAQSGLNVNAFKKYGNEADHAFVVNGDASKAVHYHQFPQTSPQVPVLMQQLAGDIKTLSGVDERYTGRDTGSIITTGGTEAMLDQVTLIDQPKINNYNHYAIRLSKLIISNWLKFGQKRKYLIQDKMNPNKYKTITIDFPSIDEDTVFHYTLDISSELPRNKARIAQMANVLMEKQMQYSQAGQKVEWITPEEWLMFQDLPYKEYMMERMGLQRSQDYLEQVSQTVFQYADLTDKGVDPTEAMSIVANTLEQQRTPQQEMALPSPEQVAPGLDQTGVAPPL